MAFQGIRLVEAFAAGFTPERLFARVYPQVPLQVSVYGKALAAVVAPVRPFACVDLLMHFQAVSSVETFPTLLTVKWPDLGVEALVVPQQLLQGEALPTDITCVWPHT